MTEIVPLDVKLPVFFTREVVKPILSSPYFGPRVSPGIRFKQQDSPFPPTFFLGVATDFPLPLEFLKKSISFFFPHLLLRIFYLSFVFPAFGLLFFTRFTPGVFSLILSFEFQKPFVQEHYFVAFASSFSPLSSMFL